MPVVLGGQDCLARRRWKQTKRQFSSRMSGKCCFDLDMAASFDDLITLVSSILVSLAATPRRPDI